MSQLVREDFDLLDSTLAEFDRAAEGLELEEAVRVRLRRCRRVVEVFLPVRLDSGREVVFSAYHAVHSTARGPALGGLRLDPGCGRREAEALALRASWRSGLLRVPFGGAQAVIRCDPKGLSPVECERVVRAFAAAFADLLDPDRDRLGPDIGCEPSTLARLLDEYERFRGPTANRIATGLPPGLGGIDCDLPAEIAIRLVELALEHLGEGLRRQRVVVQGFGALGRQVAQLLEGRGAVLVAAGDSRGATYDPTGLDLDGLVTHCRSRGSVVDFPGSETITQAELMTTDCDLLLSAASSNVIHAAIAEGITAPLVVEVSPLSISAEAEEVLNERGILVLPDLLAAAGGTLTAFLEDGRLPAASLRSEAETWIEDAFRRVLRHSRERRMPLRETVLELGIAREAEAVRARIGVS